MRFGAVIPGVSRPSTEYRSRLRGFVAYQTLARGAAMRDGRAVWPSIFQPPPFTSYFGELFP